MKKIITSSAAVLITCFVALWWYSTNQTHAIAVEAAQAFNSSHRALFTYDKIAVSGYPWASKATFVGAKLTLNPNHSPLALISETTTLRFNDPLSLTIHPLSKRVDLSFNTLTVQNDKDHYQQQGQRLIKLRFFQTPVLNNHWEQFALNVRQFTYQHQKLTTTVDGHSKTVAEPYFLSLSRKALGHNQEFYHFSLNARYVDGVTPQQLLVNTLPGLNLVDQKPYDNLNTTSSENNLINTDITVTTLALPTLVRWFELGQSGQLYLTEELLRSPPIVDVNHLQVRMPWFNWQANYHSAISKNQFNRHTHMRLHSTFTLNPEGQQLLDHLIKGFDPKGDNEAVIKTLQTLLPNLLAAGTIDCDLNIHHTPQKLHIKELNISNQHCGVSGEVDIQHNKAGHAKLVLRNYPQLVDDSIRHIKALSQLIDQLKLPMPHLSFNAEFAERVKQFLTTVADQTMANPNNITLSLHYDGQQFSLGKLKADELSQKIDELRQHIRISIPQPTQPAESLPYINDQTFQEAIRHHRGRGVALDYHKAASLYQKAIDQTGDGRAKNNLAVLKAQGKGVKRDVQKAIELLEDAAYEGNKIAELNLSNIQNQRGIPALVHYTSAFGFDVTCEHYDKQSIDNMLSVFKVMGWHEIIFLRPDQPGALPQSLRDYANKRALELGLTVLHHQHS